MSAPQVRQTLQFNRWQDLFTARTIEAFQRLRDRDVPVGLTVGPWNHIQAAQGEGILKESFDWLEQQYLAERHATQKPVRQAPVRINVTGVDKWRWLPSWPPVSRPLDSHLDQTTDGKLLLAEDTPGTNNQVHFIFDPHDPTPTLGGSMLFGAGYVDDTILAKRSDVLAFTLRPLVHDVEVMGKPRVELTHSSDNPHVDVFLRLCEVNTNGNKGAEISRNITQVYKGLDPDKTQPGQSVKVDLELAYCAHLFKKDKSIRLIVAGGWFPLYHLNLCSGEDPMTGGRFDRRSMRSTLGGLWGRR